MSISGRTYTNVSRFIPCFSRRRFGASCFGKVTLASCALYDDIAALPEPERELRSSFRSSLAKSEMQLHVEEISQGLIDLPSDVDVNDDGIWSEVVHCTTVRS